MLLAVSGNPASASAVEHPGDSGSPIVACVKTRLTERWVAVGQFQKIRCRVEGVLACVVLNLQADKKPAKGVIVDRRRDGVLVQYNGRSDNCRGADRPAADCPGDGQRAVKIRSAADYRENGSRGIRSAGPQILQPSALVQYRTDRLFPEPSDFRPS